MRFDDASSSSRAGVHHDKFVLNRMQLIILCLGAMVIGASIPIFVKPASTKSRSKAIAREGARVSKKKLRPAHKKTSPHIAWLMSFPNSGTTYTLSLVSATSNMTMASNYKTGRVTNVVPDGPFWLEPNATNTPMNDNDENASILTKTHCGGYCHRCKNPLEWLETPHSFLTHCASVKTESATVVNVYDYEKLVDRTVHLMRNPFDNMVARFHFGAHKAAKQNKTELVKRYPFNVDGFRNFCKDHTYEFEEQREKRVDQQVLRMIQHVPCHLDLFRYIQWHNLAFLVSKELLQVPTHVLHYEDYNTDLNGTLESLLGFLDLPNVGSIPSFQVGKSYGDEYFTPQERLAVRNATKKLASPLTWENLQRYFLMQ